MFARGSAFNFAGTLSTIFCFASAKTVGVGDGVGEADEVGSESFVGIGDGS